MAVLAIACTRENEDPIQEKPEEEVVQDGFKVLSIEATQVETKTAYAGEVTFSWSAGDQISVLCNDGSANFWQTFTVTEPSASSTFTATVTGDVNIGAIDGTKVALYPASDSHVYTSSSEISFHIPAERDFRASTGGHKETAIPMFAWGDGSNTFAFANLTGAVKFTFSNIPSTTSQVKFEFHSTGSSKLNGTYDLILDEDATKVKWNAVDGESVPTEDRKVTYYADVENGNASFYLPYATGKIWADNILTLSDATTSSELYRHSTVKTISVTKNVIAVLPSINVATGAVNTGYTSAYGLTWNNIKTAENTDTSYPAIKSMKAQADENYLYLLLEIDPAQLETNHTYAHRFNFYAGDWSTGFGAQSWAVYNGDAAYYNWETDYSDCTPNTSDASAWFYEIRISRQHSKTTAALGSSGTVNIGVKLDNRLCDDNGSGEVWGYSNGGSSTSSIGKIPSSGLYSVSLPATQTGGNATVLVDNSNFTEMADDIPNPERGLYKFIEYKYHKHGSTSYTAYNTNLTDSYDENNRLTLVLFYLFDYVDGIAITDDGLQYIRDVLSFVRSSKKKAIVRFAYSDQHVSSESVDPRTIHQEPTKDQILAHIAQIKPILQDYEDIIFVVQAGFIGTYGEWYYTTNFSTFEYNNSKNKWYEYRDYSDPDGGNSVTGFENRAAVLEALLDAVPASRQIELRTPAYKQYYLNAGSLSSWDQLTGFGSEDKNRLAFHNDAFLYGGDDMGTFHHNWEREMWAQQGNYLINGGEAPYSSKNPAEMQGNTLSNVRDAIYTYHYSYLHHDTGAHSSPDGNSGSSLMRYWHNQHYIYEYEEDGVTLKSKTFNPNPDNRNWMPDIKKMLGYRLYLTNVTISGTALTGGNTVSISYTLNNSGAAPVINERPMKIAFLHGSTATVLASDYGDVRTVASNGSQSFTASVTLPSSLSAGDKLAIWLPDNATALQDIPEYSIRLANNETTWSNGYNVFYTFQ